MSRTDDAVMLRLTDDEATWALFPFRFELTVSWTVRDDGLEVVFEVANPGPRTLPYTLGWHPAFAWPLEPWVDAHDHVITFEREEPERIRRIHDDLLDPVSAPTPVAGRELVLRPAPFADGGIVLHRPRSAALTYRAPGGRGVELRWTGFDALTVWTPLSSALLCLEPWCGLPASADPDARPELAQLEPGTSARHSCRIRLVPG